MDKKTCGDCGYYYGWWCNHPNRAANIPPEYKICEDFVRGGKCKACANWEPTGQLGPTGKKLGRCKVTGRVGVGGIYCVENFKPFEGEVPTPVDEIEKKALAWVNSVRAHIGKDPLDRLKVGIGGSANADVCPLAISIGKGASVCTFFIPPGVAWVPVRGRKKRKALGWDGDPSKCVPRDRWWGKKLKFTLPDEIREWLHEECEENSPHLFAQRRDYPNDYGQLEKQVKAQAD